MKMSLGLMCVFWRCFFKDGKMVDMYKISAFLFTRLKMMIIVRFKLFLNCLFVFSKILFFLQSGFSGQLDVDSDFVGKSHFFLVIDRDQDLGDGEVRIMILTKKS